MEIYDIIWGPHFERTSTRKSKCLVCWRAGVLTDMDHAGGRPQRHLASKHPDVKVEYTTGVPAAPTKTIEESPKAIVPRDNPVQEPPSEPDERTPAVVREETLRLATDLLKDPATPANARVAAARLISDIEGLQDMEQDEDEGEAEGKVVARFEKAIVRKADLEEEFRTALRDPTTLLRVKRLVAEVEATL